jgi:DNA repair exonuclease SbcCD ATPase subunit
VTDIFYNLLKFNFNMSQKEEFSKIKNSFLKVKEDINNLNELIVSNTDNFFQKHNSLSNEVFNLITSLKIEIDKLKEKKTEKKINNVSDIKEDVKHLKNHMNDIVKNNADVYAILDRIKKNDININDLKKRLDSDELEIHLLKERLLEKDFEVKKMKKVNTHILSVIDEITDIEKKILTN